MTARRRVVGARVSPRQPPPWLHAHGHGYAKVSRMSGRRSDAIQKKRDCKELWRHASKLAMGTYLLGTTNSYLCP